MWKIQKNLPVVQILVFIIIVISFSQIFSDESRIKILNVFRTPLKIISGMYYVLQDVSMFKELKYENEILKEDIENLKQKIIGLQEFGLENKRLRELLDFREVEGHKFIPSIVIAKEPLDLHDAIIIDKGKNSGVDKDKVVVSGSGLVGRVRESGWSISRVLLITDRDSAVSAIVQRTRDEGVIVGNMRQGLLMKYIELGCDVVHGDKVISSGYGGIFKKGILIGEVISVEKDASGLYMNAVVAPEVDMTRLEEVLVIK